ncbi:MAG: hypothetical protein R3249_08315 [Nitriliruptorales bacterium]|nr:hypothetical protein [Nitriliruptorales bacterium]
MYLSTDVARSDFILAAAFLVLGPLALFVVAIPVETVTGLAITSNDWVALALIVLVTVGFPRWLTLKRGDGLAGFALDGAPSAIGPGAILAVPLLVAWFVTQWQPLGPSAGVGLVDVLLGRLSGALVPNPTVGAAFTVDVGERLFRAAQTVVVFVGSVALWSFLVGRASRGFHSPERSTTQALRTYGIGAAGAAFVIGTMWSLAAGRRPVVVLANVLALVAIILLTDRMIGVGPLTTRATFIGPIIVLVYLQVQQGGADLGFNLYAAALSAGHLVVFATLIEARRKAWAALPMLAAASWIPGCSSLLHWGTSIGNPGC